MELDETTEATTLGQAPRYPIRSVDKALRLLVLFLTDDRIRVKDAARTLGVATGTAHRLLAMLQYRGYVTKDPGTKLYAPGPMLVSIGVQASRQHDVGKLARPYMERMRQRFDETIQLATLRGAEVYFVEAVESSLTLKVTSRAGMFRPAHCTSVGKALLAELPSGRVVELYGGVETLEPCAPSSISSLSELLRTLEAVRSDGYAINYGELEEGIGSVAAAIRDPRGRAVAALGVGAPRARLDDRRVQELAVAVRQVAADIGLALTS